MDVRSTLVSMNNLAFVLRDQGEHEQAEKMHQQALKLRDTVLGKEHPDALASMLVTFCMKRGQEASVCDTCNGIGLMKNKKCICTDFITLPDDDGLYLLIYRGSLHHILH
jgi:hypothetical protein